MTTAYQATAPHMCAGVEVDDAGRVVAAAPILRWTIGMDLEGLRSYCRHKNWTLERVETCF